jgi:hypothetical protein
MSEDSLTRRVRATLKIEIDYDLDSRVSNERLSAAVERIADDAASDGLFLPSSIGNETSVESWTATVELQDGDAATGGRP